MLNRAFLYITTDTLVKLRDIMAQSSNGRSYGTIAGSEENRGENGVLGDVETQALLRPKVGRASWFHEKLTVDVSRDWADVMLLACYIITGILDSAAISTWGPFVSMQTGESND